MRETAVSTPTGEIDELFDRLPVALYRSTPDGSLVVANQAVASLLGYDSVTELLERGGSPDRHCVDPSARQSWVESVLIDGQVRRLDIELRRKDGTSIWVEDTARGVFGADGELEYVDGALIEVTARVEAQRARTQSIATISHELRNPMAVLLGLAKELSQDYDGFTDEERREMAGVMARQAEDAAWIIEDLLVAYREDLSRLAVVSETFDIAEELDRVLEVTEHPVVVEKAAGSTSVVADPRRTRQILRNLVSNAVRYGGSRIEVRVEGAGDAVKVWVRDDGDPLDTEEADRIFQAFAQGSSRVPDSKSVGLGLTVARTLAGLMEGTLEYSHDGQFSSFVLTLPAAP